jgi:hypothetical protein
MTVTQTVLTFAASAQQFPAAPGVGLVCRIYAEPLRTNAAPCWVGIATVTNDGSGTGVVKQIATPPAATLPVDFFEREDMGGDNRIDPTSFWAHGTTGQKLLVSYSQV